MSLLCNLLLALSLADVRLVIDIFKLKNIKNGIIFHCYDNYVVSNVHKILNEQDILMASTKIDYNVTYNIAKSYPRVGLVIDTSCEGWTSVLDSDTISFQEYSFIVITEDLSGTTEILSQYPIEVDSDVIVAHKINQTFNLYEVFNTGTKYRGTYNVRKVGLWNTSLLIDSLNRWNLQGVFVKTAVIILTTPRIVNQTIEQYMEKPIKSQIDVDTVHRMKYFIMLKFMRDMYNISYDMHRVSTWGYQRNGSFDGMVNALYQGMAEIGGAPIFYRIDRGQRVQYISEVWMSRHSFLFRHPKYPGGFYTIYTRPLSDVVWYCVVAMLAVTAITLWVMLVVQNHKGDNEDSSLSLAGLVIWGAICQQGISINRESTSTKLVIFTTFVYAVTLYQYYNATIVSSLLLEPPRNIRTLKDILDSDLKAGAHDIVYDRDYFKRTTDPVAIELYHKKVATATHYNFFTPEEGIALVKKGGFAFHIDTTFAFPLIKATFTEREICETTLVQMYPLQRMGVVVRKHSPYKEHIAYAIRKMYEVGLPPRIQSEIDEPMPECAHTPDSSIFCVGIREFSTPLLALTLGMVTSIVVLFCELLFDRVVKLSSVREFRH
ncbi:glutamate receptor ionotropic, delta-1-like [Spodoptera litura]|uniref:Glutamate receptor ionotropic, delta-1-like n=1 Tax=Spodoptera litura TaxID=69820 RepID=A0A9J7DS48_SPOLT|nr:glutamate receptor ionotropic, delta-1-like [Spodoptera litura]